MTGSIPTPGYLAMHLARFGTPMAVAVLGSGLTLHDGQASDEEINAWYGQLAGDDDSVFTLNQHFIALERRYPYLSGYLGAVTGWTEEPSFEQWGQVNRRPRLLRGIAWSLSEHKDQGDLLGQVYNQMLSIGAGRTKVFDFITPQQVLRRRCTNRGCWPAGSRPATFTDAWCGSGTRVIAFHDLRLVFGLPVDIPYLLNDPSGIAIAMAGLNMVSHQIGPQVTLTSAGRTPRPGARPPSRASSSPFCGRSRRRSPRRARGARCQGPGPVTGRVIRPRRTAADKIAYAAPVGEVVRRQIIQIFEDHPGPGKCWCDYEDITLLEESERVDLEART